MKNNHELAAYIDHTLLKPEATQNQILTLCAEAKEHQFKGVCVNGYFIKLVSEQLINTKVLPVAVVGFPLGAMTSKMKSQEAYECSQNGAKEIDMVLRVGAVKEQNWDELYEDIHSVCSRVQIPVKVILETCLLDFSEIKKCCEIASLAGAKFVKTSTGFNTGGATIEHITLMKNSVPSHVEVKASGGIKNSEFAWSLIAAGATRLGTSSGVSLINNGTSQGGY